MTEQPQQAPAPFNIDLLKIMPTIAKYYTQFSWVMPLVGFKVPPQVDQALRRIALGEQPTQEQLEAIKGEVETLAPAVGEPVLTRELAEDAWELAHQINPKTGRRWGTRDIAELFTQEGNPCSHATVARWIEVIDTGKRFSRVARLMQIGKIAGFVGIIVAAVLIGHYFL